MILSSFLYSPRVSSWIVKQAQTKTEVGIYFSNFLRSAAKLGITPVHTRGVELMPNIQYLHNNFIELKF